MDLAQEACPSILPAKKKPLRRLLRLLWAWRSRAALDRDLSRLNDRLLRDVGIDAARLRDRAHLRGVGLPSPATIGEIAPGVPAPREPARLPLSRSAIIVHKSDRENQTLERAANARIFSIRRVSGRGFGA
jgi:uncharacterized protein YjiS (DUF1127 family)